MRFISEEITQYCEDKSTLPSDICVEIQRFTLNNVEAPQMISGPQVGSFLGILIRLLAAKRVLEVGCYTGYSALAMAERLPDNGELITIDINGENQKIAQRFWDQSPHGKKIKPLLGSANEVLNSLEGLFDFVFIDADKENYLLYLKKSLPMLGPNGVIVVDNCLWSGKVLNPGACGQGNQRNSAV